MNEAVLAAGISAPVELKIGLGFFLFFVAPGLVFMLVFFPRQRLHRLEAYPAAIALTMGLWSVPGLIAYSMEWALSTVMVVELAILGALVAAALFRIVRFVPYEPDPGDVAAPGHAVVVAAVALGLGALGLWLGAFRGVVLDWDYFNYISHVNKLVAWDRASIAHFAYADAPPDPIHSYNIWALNWAMIAKVFNLDPISLYARSAFLTIPAAGLAFYSMARRLVGADAARTALILYAAYHFIHGGLLFLGRTTFYPADSQWLIVFPSCVALFLKKMEGKSPGLLVGLALAALGLSITHVLWGLCLYIVIGLYWLSGASLRIGAWRATWAAWQTGGRLYLYCLGLWFLIPPAVMAAAIFLMMNGGDLSGRDPILGVWPWWPSWLPAALFVLVPLILFAARIYSSRPRPQGPEGVAELTRRVGVVVLVMAAVALPYALLRYQAIGATDWGQFGRNPYRVFLTPDLFFLNPFQRSLGNPNMTFYPLYLLGYLCLPVLIWKSGRKAGAWLVVAVLAAVPFICFNPAAATLFADLFSLGYLRRLLRLAAIFSVLPAGLAIHLIVSRALDQKARPVAHVIAALVIATAIGAACIPFKAKPRYYNDMLDRARKIARIYPKDSLIYDDEPFRAIEEGGWFEPDAVIFSDLWTSYRLTAYLPQFVAVQQKPGAGVKDQDERRLLEVEFFDPRTGPARRREIMDRFGAAGVIVNRNPGYKLAVYRLSCGHPEIITLLKQDPAHFEPVHDQGDWAIFKIRND